ncbi:Protein MGR2 [Ceratocystis fimbriata CBS 114723]|uniref:Protein MGR2 n=2 Tax=Ceratocystis TaxID=5157 RepID=A0A2C5XG60_9PEZI|nr:Protein MGR2 [Ceratocystis fimbriata CBS 114723]
MPALPSNHGQVGPSIQDKMVMGAITGGSVGAILGFLYGTLHIFRYGAGSSGIMRTLGQYMAGSGATFGFFMSVGSVVRSDTHTSELTQAYMRAQRQPYLVARRAFHEQALKQ